MTDINKVCVSDTGDVDKVTDTVVSVFVSKIWVIFVDIAVTAALCILYIFLLILAAYCIIWTSIIVCITG
jgi:hypothetical protein